MATRRVGILALALLTTAAVAADEGLPPGLVRQGNVIMMRPIGDSDIVAPQNTEHRVGAIRFLSPGDHDIYERAFEAADRGDWTAARNIADQGHDAMARKLVQWRYLLDTNSGASFQDIDAFVRTNPDWPLRDVLFARAEAAITPDITPAAVVAWFGTRNPTSPIGQIRLGEALVATGRAADGTRLIRDGWTNGSFDPPKELAIVLKDGPYLTPEVDSARLDNLLWRDDTVSARRELSRVDDRTARVGEARIALRTSPASARRQLDSLSGSLADDPGLLFDRAKAARRAGEDATAAALLLRITTREPARRHPSRWWAVLNVTARQMLQARDYRTAYNLVSDAGLTSGDEFQEAEFLAGWIALRYLNEPRLGLSHFQKLDAGVSRPISKARAHYWEGRCYEAIGDLSAAAERYHLAAQDPVTFYGQIALARIDPAPVLHIAEAALQGSPRPEFDQEELTHAMVVLADLGSENLLRSFAIRDEEIHPSAAHVKTLVEALTDWGYREIAVRIGKIESYDGVILLPYTHPVIAIPTYRGPSPAPDQAMVLGLIRQETEFDPDAVSGPGARGMMQMMPESARRAAAAAGLPYRPNDLLSDPQYNIQLGMTELSGYLGEWSGSLILSATSYNAGANNADRWTTIFGDPRSRATDPIDWIENITFTETRNYVQRVLENTEIYRYRLAGHDVPLRIMADLYAPNVPVMRVLSYTAPRPGDQPVPTPVPKPAPADASAPPLQGASAPAGGAVSPRPKP